MVSIELSMVLVGLFAIAVLYSSVGHGGGSGYLAVLSMTSFASTQAIWLKQYAWSLNLIVASLAFWHYSKEGHHDMRLSLPFIVASVPLATLGGYLLVEGRLYDLLLSVALVAAAWRLLSSDAGIGEVARPDTSRAVAVGGSIGLASGVIGIGGGIFLSPILMLNKWASAKEAAATASLFIWMNSLAGLAGAGLSGRLEIDLGLLFPFSLAVLLGGLIGSRHGSQVSSQTSIRGLLVVILIVAAVRRIIGTTV
ncbi:MAG: sulfite exporter TauE/SafE family protein [Candidatus Thalassarchaeaceae archaeon]|nr:sulfite exporter TauE/SafE family protein [Candidatus Thalassarchaeaceae archaeon]MEE2629879.1 sulfite exporter TauE/SafE family protein [Candidatus Thermoplasmatota archaeon]